uniref:Uncharacterized protein n=1 Tax=Heliothis virescens TaxID=7102 RepID=A0A2A4K7L3_HELVI
MQHHLHISRNITITSPYTPPPPTTPSPNGRTHIYYSHQIHHISPTNTRFTATIAPTPQPYHPTDPTRLFMPSHHPYAYPVHTASSRPPLSSVDLLSRARTTHPIALIRQCYRIPFLHRMHPSHDNPSTDHNTFNPHPPRHTHRHPPPSPQSSHPHAVSGPPTLSQHPPSHTSQRRQPARYYYCLSTINARTATKTATAHRIDIRRHLNSTLSHQQPSPITNPHFS